MNRNVRYCGFYKRTTWWTTMELSSSECPQYSTHSQGSVETHHVQGLNFQHHLCFDSHCGCPCVFQARWPSTCRTPATAVQKARTPGAPGWAVEGEAVAALGRRWVVLTLWLCLPWESQLRSGGTASPPSWSWWTVWTTPPLTCWETSQRMRSGKRARRTVTRMRAPTGGGDTASKQWRSCLCFCCACWGVVQR